MPLGSTRYLDGGRSLPLGVRPATTYGEAAYTLEPGSTLLLYTDGLVEKRRVAIDDGLARLADCASAGHDDLEELCDRILETLGPSSEDDVALLALEPTPLAPGRLTVTLPAEPLALASVRRALRRWLEQCEASEEESYEIILACNEAFANAIEHAYGPGDGLVEMDAVLSENEVSITIRDFGRWREPRGDNRGRGLSLIETVMDSMNVVRDRRDATGEIPGTELHMSRKLGGRRDGSA
jgi:anti-sigma regulatory factor (Ser/Thr protein kinase)